MQTANGLSANLSLIGQGPSIYGADVNPLKVWLVFWNFPSLTLVRADGRFHGDSYVNVHPTHENTLHVLFSIS